MKPHTMFRERPVAVKSKVINSSANPNTAGQCDQPQPEQHCAEPELSLPAAGTPSSRAQKGSIARLNGAIAQMAARGDAQKTRELLDNMEANGYEADATSYNLVMRAYCKAGDVAG